MIRKAEKADLNTLAELAVLLWNDNTASGHAQEFVELMEKDDALFLLAFAAGIAVGFAQCQLRYDYVEGTETSPVGYLEGIFVKESHRKQGLAKALLEGCQQWAREQGCREFASDCELSNQESYAFHKALHFAEANRIVCFTKVL